MSQLGELPVYITMKKININKVIIIASASKNSFSYDHTIHRDMKFSLDKDLNFYQNFNIKSKTANANLTGDITSQ